MWDGIFTRARPRVLATICTSALAACAGQAPPPAAPTPPPPAQPRLRATVIPPEVELFEGRLYATVWLNRPADAPVEIRLRGQGAPENVVTIAPGQDACAGVDFDTTPTDGTWSLRHTEACSWVAGTLVPGAYTFEIASGGQRIGSYTFSLLEVPASGAEFSLAVDPDSRAGTAYFHPAGLVYWVTVDARWETRPVSFVWFRAGQHAGTRTAQIEGPRLRGGGTPLSSVRPVLLREATLGRGEWHLTAFIDEEVVGAWHFGYDPQGRLHGLQVTRGDAFGPVAHGTLPAALLERARSEVVGRRSIERPERRICALAALPEAADLIARSSGDGAGDEEAFRRIDRLAARYSAGCMDTILQ